MTEDRINKLQDKSTVFTQTEQRENGKKKKKDHN